MNKKRLLKILGILLLIVVAITAIEFSRVGSHTSSMTNPVPGPAHTSSTPVQQSTPVQKPGGGAAPALAMSKHRPLSLAAAQGQVKPIHGVVTSTGFGNAVVAFTSTPSVAHSPIQEIDYQCHPWQRKGENGQCVDNPNVLHHPGTYNPQTGEWCQFECNCEQGQSPAGNSCSPCSYVGTVCTEAAKTASALTPAGPALAMAQSSTSIERYPNIEAPDTVAAGQEVAVQISLTAEQISSETKIVSGAQSQGKLQLQMAEGERQWTITVNLIAPGMEITRGGSNTAAITIDRDGDSTIAAFYLRAQPLDPSANGKRDTRILATLWHDGAFLARIARPLTILAVAPQPSVADQAHAPSAAMASRPMLAPAPHPATPPLILNSAIAAPDLTIEENRVGNTLVILFRDSGPDAPVKAEITNPGDLHAWINSHFAKMSTLGRGFGDRTSQPSPDLLHASDYLNAFGAELYDRFAPPVFKTLLLDLVRKNVQGKSLSIQILSDDPAIPWELMRPMLPDGATRMDFLGATFSIARWPLRGVIVPRPPQNLAVERSVVVAPHYRGDQSLAAANQELITLKTIRGFTQVTGDYVSVRQLALHPPQGIVHFAGHGAVSDKTGVPQFAILLEDSEMDPATWQALGNSDPAIHPLFFFNACDVGESIQFMNDVDGWAPALLGNGASGYIGALWPVQDKTAALFASTFYTALDNSLASETKLNIGSLLASTRSQVFRETGDATALAYVFYGDPLLVLTNKPIGH